MRARLINEMNFEKTGNPLDKIRVGQKHSPNTAEVQSIMDLNGNLIQAEYDRKKFLQNLQSGFYPSNICVLIINNPDNPKLVLNADELILNGYTGINYKDKYYKLG